MISHLLKEKSILLVLVFMICSIPVFSFADEDKTANKVIKDSDYFIYLGNAYAKLLKYNDAAEAYKQAIRIKPYYAVAHYNLGLAYENLDKYQEAVKAFKQAIRINPDIAEAHNNLGNVYAKLGKYQEAVDAFKQAIRINPDIAEAHNNLGNVFTVIP